MAINVTTRKGNVKKKRSHALNATKIRQKLNLQKHTRKNGTTVRLSTKEIRTINRKKAA